MLVVPREVPCVHELPVPVSFPCVLSGQTLNTSDYLLFFFVKSALSDFSILGNVVKL